MAPHRGAAPRVVVVDNHSTDATEAWSRALEAGPPPAAPLQYHSDAETLGFARACNQGARLAAGRHLLFLNNDTLVQPGWLEAMVGILASDPSVGVVGIQQRFPDSGVIHHTGTLMTADRGPQHLHPHSRATAGWPSLCHAEASRSRYQPTGSRTRTDDTHTRPSVTSSRSAIFRAKSSFLPE